MATLLRVNYPAGHAGLLEAITAASTQRKALDFQGNVDTLTSTISLGAGFYMWRNFAGERLSGTTSETIITFTGSDYGTSIKLAENVSVGQRTFTVTDASTLDVGKLYLLISKGYVHGTHIEVLQGANNRSRKSRRVVIESIIGNTVTLTEPLKSSFLVADAAGLIDLTSDCVVDIQGTLTGSGVTKSQIGMKFLRCQINGFDVEGYDIERVAFQVDQGQFACVGAVHVERSNLAGTGYGISLAGCYNPKLQNITGDDVRHLVTLTHSSAFTYEGETIRINGEGGWTDTLHCENAIGSPFDTHWGWSDHLVIGNITGTWAGSVSQEAVTIQAANIQFLGTITIEDSPQGITVQHFGVPSDEAPNKIWFNECNLGTTTNVSVAVLESYDSSALDIRIMSLNGTGPQGLVIEDETTGGDITAWIKNINVTSQTNYGMAINAKQSTGTIVVTIDGGSITSQSATTSHSGIRAFASTQDTPQRSRVILNNTNVTAVTTGLKADSGKITLSKCSVTAPAYKAITGNGEVVDSNTAKKFRNRFR